jgi:MerR family transcriptional regulator, copper efflux regulator
MRISQLAERAGLSATTLRFYETAGLLPAERSPAGHRLYGREALDRLAFIRAAKHLGLRLEEIAELLRVWSAGSCAEVKAALRPRVAGRLAEAEARVAGLTAFTGSLRQALTRLAALPDRSGRCDAHCLDPAPDRVPPDTGRWREAPVACALGGGDLAGRVQSWRRLLDGAGRETIDDGVRLSLPAGRTAALAALAADEQRCCPFFDFRLHLDGPVVRLEVRAPAAGASLLTELFGRPVDQGE